MRTAPSTAGPSRAHFGLSPPRPVRSPAVPDTRATPRHPGFTVSVSAGAVGVLLILSGALLGADGVLVAGVVAGAISLLAALVWRADLVASWRAGKRSG